VKRLLIIMAVLAIAGAACSSESDAGEGDEVSEGPVVAVSDSDLGEILTDADGNTLYLFLPDDQGDSVCADACAEAWPPFTESVSAGDGVDAALLGSTARPDGATQVTYNDWPLYRFANDAAPGDVNGQGVNDVWFVVTADGNAGK
jgi:predicted lipoprotein with Yx(FWY)xxD motif